MKRIILFITVISLVSGLTFVLNGQTQQAQPEATLRLTRPEIEAIYSIIDESATPGSIRKPLLQKIEAAYTIAFTQKQPVKNDTINKTKKN